MPKTLPLNQTPKDEVLATLRAMRGDDAKWKDGKTFSLVYFAGDEVSSLLKEAYGEFIAENGLSPVAFPSLRKMECEVVSMAADLFHGDADVAGTMTSGGTESIMMAVKAARDFAKKTRGITAPELVVPCTIHPAFDKAAHYFGVKILHAKMGPDFRVDLADLERLITPNTVMIVGSAPPYPHGVIDPITDIAALATKKGVWCHVDACVGGFFLPFAEKLGRAIPPWDFRVPGVTSISADLHKYGYAAKGASTIFHRSEEDWRHQAFDFEDWPAGGMHTPTVAGTRPGGAIASAWAVMQYLGVEGYCEKARAVTQTREKLMAAIRGIDGLRTHGEPILGLFTYGSARFDIFAVWGRMARRGWFTGLTTEPRGIHLMLSPAHAGVADEYLADLRESVAEVIASGESAEGTRARYA